VPGFDKKHEEAVQKAIKSGREVAEPVCACAYRKSRKCLRLRHAPCRNRTYNPVIKSHLLCQLS
jgi:hypothetical protein